MSVLIERTEGVKVDIMDISMKELNGIEATALIKAECPAARVLILSC